MNRLWTYVGLLRAILLVLRVSAEGAAVAADLAR
jgi:hypothetical protein